MIFDWELADYVGTGCASLAEVRLKVHVLNRQDLWVQKGFGIS